MIWALKKKWCRHKWYYALGTTDQERSGETRQECFRRVCKSCKKQEFIVHYNDLCRFDGITYFGVPVWMDEKHRAGKDVREGEE